jgi:hypothetical protein
MYEPLVLSPSETVSTWDDLSHGFCVNCYPPDGAVIVSLCGVLHDEQKIVVATDIECVVCDSFDSCPRCGTQFYRYQNESENP